MENADLAKENDRLKRKIRFLEQCLKQSNTTKEKYSNLLKQTKEKDIKYKLLEDQLKGNMLLLEQFSSIDRLTNLGNRRNFDEVFVEELNRSKRQGYEFNFMIINIDDFKSYNDTYGYQQGDEVLRKVGKILNRFSRRSSDFAFRYGGEEFIYLSSYQGKKRFSKLCKSIQEDILNQKIEHKNGPFGIVSVSIGAVISTKVATSKEDIFKNADENLQKSKNNGKNQATLTSI